VGAYGAGEPGAVGGTGVDGAGEGGGPVGVRSAVVWKRNHHCGDAAEGVDLRRVSTWFGSGYRWVSALSTVSWSGMVIRSHRTLPCGVWSSVARSPMANYEVSQLMPSYFLIRASFGPYL
jgi:hypothetical protein